MSGEPLVVTVIIGSTREGRFGPTVANWFMERARNRTDMNVSLLDLKDFELPSDKPRHDTPEVEKFAAQIDKSDAFVVVTPEYNHGYPGPLKVAIDAIYSAWAAKPVAFVSYGGISGGLRSVEQLRLVFAEVHATTIRDTVSFHNAHHQFTEDGQLKDPERANAAAEILLDKLAWWARALRAARQREPYTIE